MFLSPLDTRTYLPGEWVMLEPLIWRSYHVAFGLIEVVVPRGFITDLASVPRPLRGLVETDGLSRKPATLHDWLYCSGRVLRVTRYDMPLSVEFIGRADADGLLRDALAAEGAGWWHRNSFYAGVRIGGWRYWNQRKGRLRTDDFVAPEFWRSAA